MNIYNHKFNNLKLENWECDTLILGTFNPENGPYADFYYGRIRGEKAWSNRFWPSLSEYLISEKLIIEPLILGDIKSKLDVMKKLKFNCKDLIFSIETKLDENKINSNGFSDIPLMDSSNKIKYNSQSIIEFIKEKKVKKVISSWGKGTTLSKSFLNELLSIQNNCKETEFKLYDLPAFGRPMIKNIEFGKMLFNEMK